MTSPTTSGEFLKWLSSKIVNWKNPNNQSTILLNCDIDFKNYKISMHDFSRLLDIIVSEKLLVLPLESNTGKVDGYVLYGINASKTQAVMAFTKKNIPAQYTLESLFPLCHSPQNVELLSYIAGEYEMRKNFIKQKN